MRAAAARAIAMSVAVLVMVVVGGCARARASSVTEFCEAWRGHVAEVPEGVAQVQERNKNLRPILASAPAEINQIVGRYAASVQKGTVDANSRREIETYVAKHCGKPS